jgi:UDP-N-acetylmuramate-alanine ligase
VEQVQDVAAAVLDTVRDGDLVLLMGAGSIDGVVEDLAAFRAG